MDEAMKVKILVGAAAYACIETKSISMDIKLEPGRSPSKSLREYAEEQKTKAARLLRNATLALEAAQQLEGQTA